MKPKVYIETERLIIRQWLKEDLKYFFRMNSNPEVMRYFPKLLSREESDSFVERASAQIDKRGYSFWALELKENSKFVGAMGVNNVNFKEHFTPAVEIGWRLDNNFWRQGLGFEGAISILDYAFYSLMLKEVVSFTSKINGPSIGLMEKIGMQRDKNGDFDHPNVERKSPLSRHVLYRISYRENRKN